MIPVGFAKKQFSQFYQKSPWKNNWQKSSHYWPLIDEFLQQKRLSYLDVILAQKLLINYPKAGQEIAFFICYLILAAKKGHLCVHVDEKSIFPEPVQIWQQEGVRPLQAREAETLHQLILKGSLNIPKNLITKLTSNEERTCFTPICQHIHLFYLQRHWLFETVFLKHLNNLFKSKTRLQINKDELEIYIKNLEQKGVLLTEQAQAIKMSCLQPFSLITGGPGTGKTYTAGYLIKAFWENLTEEDQNTCSIILAAPTGKAAANLQNSLENVIKDLKNFPLLTAKTLHALLEIKGPNSKVQERKKMGADLILIDESSMIDIKLMALLLESIREGSRLILLGDPYQLPSVEAGSVFSDLIHLQNNSSIQNPFCKHLKTCLRTELQSIVDFAKLVNEGQAQQAIEFMKIGNQAGIGYTSLSENYEEVESLLRHKISAFFPSLIKEEDEMAILKSFNKTRLLSPLRKGLLGVETINQWIWNSLSQTKSMEGWLAVPIIIIKNDYRQSLFNGETGVLMRKLPLQENFSHTDDYAIFYSRDRGMAQTRKIPAVLLPAYEYAYCLSVHKSQGSEFEHVILMIPEGSEIFGKEVLYTGITRARKYLDIYGSETIIYKTIMQQGKRLSGIQKRAKNFLFSEVTDGSSTLI